MKYLSLAGKLAVFQVVLVSMGINLAFCETVHISGSAQGNSKSTIAHISGMAHPGAISSQPKAHVSGGEQVAPVQKPAVAKPKILKKASITSGTPEKPASTKPKVVRNLRNMGITLGTPEKSASTKPKVVRNLRNMGITLGTPEKSASTKPKVVRNLRNKGITLGTPEKSASVRVDKKAAGKIRKRMEVVKVAEQASLQDRIKQRKACWKACENTWKINIQGQCSTLSGSQNKVCKKGMFKERLTCVRLNCRK